MKESGPGECGPAWPCSHMKPAVLRKASPINNQGPVYHEVMGLLLTKVMRLLGWTPESKSEVPEQEQSLGCICRGACPRSRVVVHD